jgi:hypothetical protein
MNMDRLAGSITASSFFFLLMFFLRHVFFKEKDKRDLGEEYEDDAF